MHLKIGGIQTTTVVPRLSADIHFKFTNKVGNIAGVYHFPADNNRVYFFLNEKVNGDILTVGVPVSGSLVMTYNAATKSLNGTIANVSYAQVLHNTFVSELLNGKFSKVGLSK